MKNGVFPFFKKSFFLKSRRITGFFEVFGKKAPLLSTFVVTPVTTVERSGAMLLTVKKIALYHVRTHPRKITIPRFARGNTRQDKTRTHTGTQHETYSPFAHVAGLSPSDLATSVSFPPFSRRSLLCYSGPLLGLLERGKGRFTLRQ